MRSHLRALLTILAVLAAMAPAVLTVADLRGALQRDLFSAAEAYERFMGRWSRVLAEQFVTFARVRDGDAVLDVGSGTGALTRAIAALAPSGPIIGVDPAAPYVAFARARRAGKAVDFEVGDAQRLRFPAGSFDRTMSLLVLNFVADPAEAMQEMMRVTRPGGVVAAAVWDYGHGMEMLRVFWDEAIALKPSMDARDERHMPLARAGELASLWRDNGLENVVETGLTIETTFRSFDDYWSPFLGGQGPAGAFVASLKLAERAELRARLRRRLLGVRPDGPIALEARAWAVRGTVPGAIR